MRNKLASGVLIALVAVTTTSQATPSTDLSRKARAMKNGMSPTEVRSLLGSPTSVISPKNLKANDIDPSPDIHYVLTWNNPGCSRVEVIFSQGNRVTGWDGGELCMDQKALPATYSCTNASNAKYCSK